MTDYISREAAVERIKSSLPPNIQIEWEQPIRECLPAIEYTQAADVVEVKRGRWIFGVDVFDDMTYYCSVCQEPWTLIEGTPRENKMHYCPNCGAKMDGGDHDAAD